RTAARVLAPGRCACWRRPSRTSGRAPSARRRGRRNAAGTGWSWPGSWPTSPRATGSSGPAAPANSPGGPGNWPPSAARPGSAATGSGRRDRTRRRADARADPFTELSDAERRVAALAAEGWTNRQIAKRLHVTTSTVEQHLTRVYRKLRINRRTDLPLDLAGIPPRDFLA
ncbi:helix-turn-helix domain-containing protein, partial [Actinomadura sp. CNU-125]|uniref:helix-turn-helix domain-containing protein n=1 Tax=Actinomadura sp. CNU-125 TaxID=1904961 RepID=UPI0011775D5F